MKIVIINGQNHKSTTNFIARELANKVGGEITEFFLPRDFGEFCVGCTNCFAKDKKLCPHYEKLLPLTNAMLEADLIILASPVYVYHVTGSMKAFLDHYGYMWLIHRPEEAMFKKQAVCISTSAGAGHKSTNMDMAHSFFYWGIPKIYKIGLAVHAAKFGDLKQDKKDKIEKLTSKIAKKIIKNKGKVRPKLKTRLLFYGISKAHKKGISEVDTAYWKEKGWLEKKRPWKN